MTYSGYCPLPSPTMATPLVLPPWASIGMLGVPILKPPTPKLRPFHFPITQLMAFRNASLMPSNRPPNENLFFNPLNRLTRLSIQPRTVLMTSIHLLTTSQNLSFNQSMMLPTMPFNQLNLSTQEL